MNNKHTCTTCIPKLHKKVALCFHALKLCSNDINIKPEIYSFLTTSQQSSASAVRKRNNLIDTEIIKHIMIIKILS